MNLDFHGYGTEEGEQNLSSRSRDVAGLEWNISGEWIQSKNGGQGRSIPLWRLRTESKSISLAFASCARLYDGRVHTSPILYRNGSHVLGVQGFDCPPTKDGSNAPTFLRGFHEAWTLLLA